MKSKKIIILFLAVMAVAALCSFDNVSDDDMRAMGVDDMMLLMAKTDTIDGRGGRVDFPECHAHINVPEDFLFLDSIQAKKLLVEYWGNPVDRTEGLLGVIVPKSAESFYQISLAYVVKYDNCGYIKDKDAESIDYDDLLDMMREQMEEENKTLPSENKVTLVGWAVPPRYIKDSHVLIWAKSLKFGEAETVNYDMRFLGKDGLVSINAVSDLYNVKEIDTKGNDVISCFSFDEGYLYADFDPKRDRISDWTIGGLIAGGILAKSGFFAKLGVLLLKFWKLALLAFVGLLGAISKLFKRKRE